MTVQQKRDRIEAELYARIRAVLTMEQNGGPDLDLDQECRALHILFLTTFKEITDLYPLTKPDKE